MNPTIEGVFRTWEQESVTWCLLRGERELETSADVDLLVARPDLDRVRPLLRGLGFAELPSRGHGPHVFFLTYDGAADRWIKLDVVDELSFGPGFALRTGAEEECLARRRQDGLLALLDPDSAFWALLLHCLLDKGAVHPRQRAALARLATGATGEGPLGQVVADACPPEWTPRGIVEAAHREDCAALLALAPQLEARWSKRGRTPGRVRRKASRLANRLQRPGLSVALLAPDGAGKTTLAASLADSFYFPVRTVYMGLDQSPPRESSRRKIPGVGLGRRLLTAWGRYLGGRAHQSSGELIVFDRYTYDSLLPPTQAPTRSRRLRRWLLSHACPAPDLVVVLDAPAEVMRARRPEHSLARLEEQRRHYRRLAEKLDAAVVDASREPDVVLREVESILWRALAARIGKD